MTSPPDPRTLAGPAPAWKAEGAFTRLPGVERVRSRIDGLAPDPPGYLLVGMSPTAVAAGDVVYRMPGSPWLAGFEGRLDPAALAYFLDAPVANAVHSDLAPGETLRTVHLGIRFRPAPDPTAGPFTARCVLAGRDGDDGQSEATITAGDGSPVASSDCRVITLPYPGGPGDDEEPEYPDTPSPLPFEMPLEWTAPDPGRRGLDVLTAAVDDPVAVPPFWRLLGCRPTDAEPGRVSVAMPADLWLSSPAMLLYGGALASLGVAALAAALLSGDAPGERTRMATCTYESTRMVPPDGSTLVAEARLAHRGRTLAVADAEVLDASGRLAGLGRATGRVVAVPGSSRGGDR